MHCSGLKSVVNALVADLSQLNLQEETKSGCYCSYCICWCPLLFTDNDAMQQHHCTVQYLKALVIVNSPRVLESKGANSLPAARPLVRPTSLALVVVILTQPCRCWRNFRQSYPTNGPWQQASMPIPRRVHQFSSCGSHPLEGHCMPP